MVTTDETTPVGQELATPDLKYSVKSMLGGLIDIARTQIWFDVVVRNNGLRVCTILARNGEFEVEPNYLARGDVVEQIFMRTYPSVTFAEFMLDLHASKIVRRIDIKYGKNAWVSVFIHKDSVIQVRPNGNHFARALNDIVIAAKGIPDIGLDEQPKPMKAPRQENPSRPSSTSGRPANASGGRPLSGAIGSGALSPSGGAIRKAKTVVDQPKEEVQEDKGEEVGEKSSLVVTKTDEGRTVAMEIKKGKKETDAKKKGEKKKYEAYQKLLQVVESLTETLSLEFEPEDNDGASDDNN